MRKDVHLKKTITLIERMFAKGKKLAANLYEPFCAQLDNKLDGISYCKSHRQTSSLVRARGSDAASCISSQISFRKCCK